MSKVHTYGPWSDISKGITVIEASAGTGKTYQITNIALRMLTEENVDIAKFLIMTFTRAATAELKQRVRQRLTDAYLALQGLHQSTDTFIIKFVGKAQTAGVVELYTTRLRDALSAFDQACIVTIHSFCQRMLQDNAFESSTPFSMELVQSVDDILEDIVDDTLSSSLYSLSDDALQALKTDHDWNRKSLLDLAKAASSDHIMTILPTTSGHPRADFARTVRLRVQEELSRRGQLSFNDLLSRLAQPLTDHDNPERADAIRTVIADKFDVILLDEFQDTDKTQWDIFSRVFATGHHHLYLIGDPKQAIYSFRGANIHVYMDAIQRAKEAEKRTNTPRVFTMTRNYRSDQALVSALADVFNQPDFFANPGIQYIHVDADHQTQRLIFPTSRQPGAESSLQIRLCDGRLLGGDAGWVDSKTLIEPAIAANTADEIVTLLNAQATIDCDGTKRPVTPDDIAVLVRDGRQSTMMQNALRRVGVPAITSSSQSVFDSPEADALQLWLEAVRHSHRLGHLRAAASTHLFGWTASTLIMADDPLTTECVDWQTWQSAVRQAGENWTKRGFYPLLQSFIDDFSVKQRLLSTTHGVRAVTNLQHAAELLQNAVSTNRLTLRGACAWLSEQRNSEDAAKESAEQRLETDADTVRIYTMHKSKGLQFGIVFAPFLWTSRSPTSKNTKNLVAPHPTHATQRVLDTRDTKDHDKQPLIEAMYRQEQEEAIRLLYVAFTRAEYQLYVTFAAVSKDAPGSPLAAALLGHASAGDCIQAAKDQSSGLSLEQIHDHLTKRLPNANVTLARTTTYTVWAPPFVPEPTLDCDIFSRLSLDNYWSRHSYSSLQRALHHRHETHLTDDSLSRVDHDQSVDTSAVSSRPSAARADTTPQENVPFSDFPAGAQAGTFLHDIYEHTPFSSTPEKIAEIITPIAPRHGYSAKKWSEPLAQWIHQSLTSPLGGPLANTRLADIPGDRRLDELDFDYTVGNGSAVQGADLLNVLTSHQGSTGLPDHYLTTLSTLNFPTLAGLLTGSIDLVFQVPVDGHAQWFVADYKSNRLDPNGTRTYPLRNFSTDHMEGAMNDHHYHLQYVLYTLAVHRYLTLRVPNYDYTRDFGGVYYLFVRGMTGSADHGSYFRRPTFPLIQALDNLFKGAA